MFDSDVGRVVVCRIVPDHGADTVGDSEYFIEEEAQIGELNLVNASVMLQ